MEFEEVIQSNFNNGQLLGSLIKLVEDEAVLSELNGKEVMYAVIDSEAYASKSIKDVVSEVLGSEILESTGTINYEQLVSEALESNQKTIDKYIKACKKKKKGKKGGGQGQIMFFVGQVMKQTNKQGDPKAIA